MLGKDVMGLRPHFSAEQFYDSITLMQTSKRFLKYSQALYLLLLLLKSMAT